MVLPAIDRASGERQTLDDIADWHRGMVDALGEQRVAAQKALQTGLPVSPRFVGMTEGDVDRHYDSQRRELERLTVANLVASAEAAIKIDYFERIGEKRKDELSVAYRNWHKTLSATKQRRPDLDEGGILDVVKDVGAMDNHIIGRYRECLRVRHWVGHGRYWAKPAAVDRLDPDEVYARADQLLRALVV